MNINGLDLAILKVITEDKNNGLRFTREFGSELFEGDIRPFASMVTQYISSYSDIPSIRTLTDKHPDKRDYIRSIFDELDSFDYNKSDYTYDLEKIKNRYVKSSLDKINSITSNENDDEYKIKDISRVLQNISLVKNGRTAIQKTVRDHFDDFRDRYNAIRENPDSLKLFETGFSTIDTSTSGGLTYGELFIVAGETNAGKSIFLNTMARNMWLQSNSVEKGIQGPGANVMYFSLEMPYDDCFSRWIASVAGVPDRAVSKADLDYGQFARVEAAERFIKEYKYEFEIVDVPRQVTVEEIELRFNDSLSRYTPDIVVVDYLGIMGGENSKEQDWLKLGNIAAGLHEFARANNVIVLTAVQATDMKRSTKGEGGKTEEQRVGVHRIGRSSQIMHHANVGIQIDSRPGERNFADFKYNLIKNRKGPLGVGTCRKNFEMGCIEDVIHSSVTSGSDISGVDLSQVLGE